MDRDESVLIERVANGFIVKSSRDYGHPERAMTITAYRESIYVFETFESMAKWLDAHFTKPGAEDRG